MGGSANVGLHAITVTQCPHMVMIGDYAAVLPIDYLAHISGQFVLERLAVLRLGIILATFALFEYRLVVSTGDRFPDAHPAAQSEWGRTSRREYDHRRPRSATDSI